MREGGGAHRAAYFSDISRACTQFDFASAWKASIIALSSAVGVFAASNFPLAFSVAGGDTASALAAGCPVVVKAHPAHPATSELVAGAIVKAARATGMPDGVFSLVHSTKNEIGRAHV